MSVHLVDLCELIVDCEHKTAPTEVVGYPSIRTPHIGRDDLIIDHVNRVSEETYRHGHNGLFHSLAILSWLEKRLLETSRLCHRGFIPALASERN